MLLPLRQGSAIPPSLRSASGSSSSRDASVRARVLRRDGPISPLGQAIDFSAAEYILNANPERVERLEAAHIMPFMVAKYSSMQTLLSMFAGTNLWTILKDKNINSPCNIFCTNHGTHELFDEFVIGALGPFITHCQDGEELVFGNGPEGTTIDLPDGELFNIHLAIANVLHASGAGEVIDKVLQDEEEYKEGTVTDEVSGSRILAFALRQALNGLKATDSIDSPTGSDDGTCKQGPGGKEVLRVKTNSQADDR
ncbi:hypothetical protein V1525DRAFT_425141 [Lipomyces kononenkoae]|uniref:Uncharacterized protein n=1 Tax=Lipomyces kononenkoae TaxID=34357 RepID=A0ACC3T4C5_LIPKO